MGAASVELICELLVYVAASERAARSLEPKKTCASLDFLCGLGAWFTSALRRERAVAHMNQVCDSMVARSEVLTAQGENRMR
jgi:hypothetical protein